MSRVSSRLRPDIWTSRVSAWRAPKGKTEMTVGPRSGRLASAWACPADSTKAQIAAATTLIVNPPLVLLPLRYPHSTAGELPSRPTNHESVSPEPCPIRSSDDPCLMKQYCLGHREKSRFRTVLLSP